MQGLRGLADVCHSGSTGHQVQKRKDNNLFHLLLSKRVSKTQEIWAFQKTFVAIPFELRWQEKIAWDGYCESSNMAVVKALPSDSLPLKWVFRAYSPQDTVHPKQSDPVRTQPEQRPKGCAEQRPYGLLELCCSTCITLQ